MQYNIKDNFISLNIAAKPNAKQTRIVEILPDSIKISLHAPAQDGKANKELINFLSKKFSIPKREIVILQGKNNTLKVIKMTLSKDLQDFIHNLNQ